jgi:MFS transporter, DHA1 family, multidrug resistance protein
VETWKRNLYSLWATEFLAALGISFVLPFLPFYIRELGIQDLHAVELWSGFIYAGPFVMGTFTGPLWGWLGDRYGRKMMLIRAVFGFGITCALMAFAQTVEQLFILRLIQGAVSGFIAATLAIVATTTPREHMGYAMGVLQTSLITGGIIGPFCGGFLADQIGYRHIFLVTGGFAFLAALVVIFLVEENPAARERKDSPSFLSNFRFVFNTPILIMVLLAGFIVQLANMAISPILALFVEALEPGALHIATLAGSVFAITGVAALFSAPFWGKQGHRLGYKKTLTINLLCAGLTFIPQALVNRIYQLLILRFVHGLFIGGILPALYTLTSLNVPEERRGGVMGITRSGLLLGNMAGPITGGVIASSLGMRPLFIFTAALLLTLSLTARRLIREPEH